MPVFLPLSFPGLIDRNSTLPKHGFWSMAGVAQRFVSVLLFPFSVHPALDDGRSIQREGLGTGRVSRQTSLYVQRQERGRGLYCFTTHPPQKK